MAKRRAVKLGETVIVSTFDGRALQAIVLEVLTTVAGIKVRVLSGHLLLVVRPDQILGKARK
jgi:hypothetical protein